MRRHILIGRAVKIYLLLVFAFTGFTNGQSIVLPVDVHMPLLFKALSLERGFSNSEESIYTIVVLYEKSNENSVRIKEEISEFSAKQHSLTINDKPVEFNFLDINHKKNIQTLLHGMKATAVYVAPVTRSEIRDLTNASKLENIISMTGVPEYVEEGVTLGIGMKGNAAEIIINLPSSKEEGVEFSSKVLGIARVIQ